nr:hypothetical protein [uncultured Oscillibacter sp.]
MKKWCLFLSVYFCVCLLAACGASGAAAPSVSSGDTAGERDGEAQISRVDSPDWPVTTVCRIVDGAESGELLLAERDGGGIYFLNEEDVYQITVGGGSGSAAEMGNGMLVNVVHDGMVLDTWPIQFSSVKALCPATKGEGSDEYDFDDRCTLYLRVLEDLWEVDPGLNSNGMTYIGVDLSQTSLSESERAAVAWGFAQKHGGELVQGTYDELVEQGYITSEPLEGTDAKFWQWKDGCLFSITERDEPVTFNLPSIGPGEEVPSYDAVHFDAKKWRSSLGAYVFSDCTAVRNADGQWGDHTVGSEMIS